MTNTGIITAPDAILPFEGGHKQNDAVGNYRKFWWWWAALTPAVRVLAATLELPLNPESPGSYNIPKPAGQGFSYQRWQPWSDRGEDAHGHIWETECLELRDALNDPDAGILFTERCSGGYGTNQSDFRSNRYLIAVNADGTRCAYANVGDHRFLA